MSEREYAGPPMHRMCWTIASPSCSTPQTPTADRGARPTEISCDPERGILAEQRAVPLNTGQDPPRKPVVVAAERGTGPAHAVMIDRNAVTINGREDPPAGARGHGADRRVPGSAPPPFLLPQEHAALLEQAVDPVLRGAPGDTGGFLDLRDRKKALVERELAHQAQVGAPVFKHAGHSGRGYRAGRR